MTEKEKMLAGILYDANNDKNLLKERMLCKDICFEYNNVKPSDTKTQELLIKKLLPDDIKQVNSTIDEEVDKEYIYYESSKGNFRVGLSYGYEFNDENIEVVNKNKVVGIDYSKEVK